MGWKMRFVRNWGRLGMKFNCYTLKDLVNIKYGKNQKKVVSDDGEIPIYGTGGLMGYATEALFEKPSVLIGRKGTISKVKYVDHPFWTVDTLFYTEVNEDIVIPRFLYYVMSQLDLNAYNEGTTIPSLRTETLNRLEFDIPSIQDQMKILGYLSIIDEKIQNNKAINENLEQQLQTIFIKMFGSNIDKMPSEQCAPLGELVTSVDNRGKTPPLATQETEFPIIDVRALSGTSRIVDYNNCTKYVEYETYKNWFRSGHPKPFDILISTVGSLAEMRVFLGSKGCIAQNVVAFRSNGVSPLYLYQYLSFIKSDLVAYNIGSVQPSIKVTHIIKHLIYIPDMGDLNRFDALAVVMTNQIYQNCQENEYLTKLRDSLLPKLMSGEIKISEVKI